MLPLLALTLPLLAPRLLPPALTPLLLRLMPLLLLLLRLMPLLLLRRKKRSKSQPFGAWLKKKKGGFPSGGPPFFVLPVRGHC